MFDNQTPLEKVCEVFLKLKAENKRLQSTIDILEHEIEILRGYSPEDADRFLSQALKELSAMEMSITAIQMNSVHREDA